LVLYHVQVLWSRGSVLVQFLQLAEPHAEGTVLVVQKLGRVVELLLHLFDVSALLVDDPLHLFPQVLLQNPLLIKVLLFNLLGSPLVFLHAFNTSPLCLGNSVDHPLDFILLLLNDSLLLLDLVVQVLDDRVELVDFLIESRYLILNLFLPLLSLSLELLKHSRMVCLLLCDLLLELLVHLLNFRVMIILHLLYFIGMLFAHGVHSIFFVFLQGVGLLLQLGGMAFGQVLDFCLVL